MPSGLPSDIIIYETAGERNTVRSEPREILSGSFPVRVSFTSFSDSDILVKNIRVSVSGRKDLRMKKAIALTLALLLALAPVCTALASDLNYAVLENSKLLEIDKKEDGLAFVSSAVGLTIPSHEGELPDYPSYVYSDIVIGDYGEPDSAAVWRFWVSYSGRDYPNADSMTVILNGKEYLFRGVSFEGCQEDYDTNKRESLRVVFGYGTMPFWLDVMTLYQSLEDVTELPKTEFTVILHGDRDVTLQVPGSALLDMAIIGDAFLAFAGMDRLIEYDGSDMETP